MPALATLFADTDSWDGASPGTDRRLDRFVRWLAASLALVVAITIPLGYFTVAVSGKSAVLQTSATIRSGMASQVAAATPELWAFQTLRLERTLQSTDPGELGVIFSQDDQVVARQGAAPPWPTLSRRAPIFVAGESVGYLEVTHSLRRLLMQTGAVALLGFVLAGIIFALLRVLPLRVLNRVFEALRREKQLVEETLRASDRTVQELAVARDVAESTIAHNEKITRDLHDAQARLVTSARAAGRAEIANNVLHNVGNVLNSVNVSAAVVTDRVRNTKAKGLDKAVKLMDEHAGDLGRFMAEDERGKLLHGYFATLAKALAAERQGVVEELGVLTKSIDHIKSIVAAQQAYSGSSRVLEPMQIQDLLEDVLHIQTESLSRHRVTVHKQFADVPLLVLDATLLQQILVNLVANAIQAMSLAPTRQLTLTVELATVADQQRLRVLVADSGEGIARETLPRLFVHGFTTRARGHGFGLHSSALAALEMGGTLKVHSDGLGAGAVFTLELPAISPEPVLRSGNVTALEAAALPD